MAKTNYISDWKTWEELCERWAYDPYKTIGIGIDEGGGNSTDYEYIGDTPEREEERMTKTPKDMNKYREMNPWRKLELALERIEKLKTQTKGLIADYKYALSKIPEKPQVTEEWIEEKAEYLETIIGRYMLREKYIGFDSKDFIRSLVEEVRGK